LNPVETVRGPGSPPEGETTMRFMVLLKAAEERLRAESAQRQNKKS
jgi:hypothetical protein